MSLTYEQERFNSDGSKDWYESAWGSRFAATSDAGKPALYVPVELLEAAVQFLRRCKPFATEKMALEIHQFLKTFPPSQSDAATKPNPRACFICGFAEKEHDATTHQYVPKGPSKSDAAGVDKP